MRKVTILKKSSIHLVAVKCYERPKIHFKVSDLLEKLKGRYKDNDKDAQAYLSVGDSPRDKKFNAAEHAAWAQVSLTVLASDVALRVY